MPKKRFALLWYLLLWVAIGGQLLILVMVAAGLIAETLGIAPPEAHVFVIVALLCVACLVLFLVAYCNTVKPAKGTTIVPKKQFSLLWYLLLRLGLGGQLSILVMTAGALIAQALGTASPENYVKARDFVIMELLLIGGLGLFVFAYCILVAKDMFVEWLKKDSRSSNGSGDS